jgi:hypothetical protein
MGAYGIREALQPRRFPEPSEQGQTPALSNNEGTPSSMGCQQAEKLSRLKCASGEGLPDQIRLAARKFDFFRVRHSFVQTPAG